MKNKISGIISWFEKYAKIDMNYIIKGGFWLSFGKINSVIIAFALMFSFGNWLEKEVYGTYQFILSSLALFSIWTLPEINTSLVKSIAQKKEGTFALAVREKIKWGFIGSLFALALATWYIFKGNFLLSVAFIVGAISVPFRSTFPIFVSFWNGRKRFDIQAKYDNASNGLTAIFLVATIYFTNNIIVILTVFLGCQTLFSWFFYKKTESQKINNEQDPQAISFGKHLTLISAIEVASQSIDKILIWKFLGATSVAIYSFAYAPIQKIQEAIPIVPLSLPKLGEAKIDKERKNKVLYKFFQLFIISIPITIILIISAPIFYKVFLPQYLESVIYFQFLSLLIAISPILLLKSALIAETKKEAFYIINAGGSFLKILLFFILIPYFGIWGILASILTAQLTKGLLAFYFFLKI